MDGSVLPGRMLVCLRIRGSIPEMKLPSRCQHLLVLAGSCSRTEGVLIHKRDLYSCVFMDMGFALQNLACIRIYYHKPISRIVLFWLLTNLSHVS